MSVTQENLVNTYLEDGDEERLLSFHENDETDPLDTTIPRTPGRDFETQNNGLADVRKNIQVKQIDLPNKPSDKQSHPMNEFDPAFSKHVAPSSVGKMVRLKSSTVMSIQQRVPHPGHLFIMLAHLNPRGELMVYNWLWTNRHDFNEDMCGVTSDVLRRELGLNTVQVDGFRWIRRTRNGERLLIPFRDLPELETHEVLEPIFNEVILITPKQHRSNPMRMFSNVPPLCPATSFPSLNVEHQPQMMPTYGQAIQRQTNIPNNSRPNVGSRQPSKRRKFEHRTKRDNDQRPNKQQPAQSHQTDTNNQKPAQLPQQQQQQQQTQDSDIIVTNRRNRSGRFYKFHQNDKPEDKQSKAGQQPRTDTDRSTSSKSNKRGPEDNQSKKGRRPRTDTEQSTTNKTNKHGPEENQLKKGQRPRTGVEQNTSNKTNTRGLGKINPVSMDVVLDL